MSSSCTLCPLYQTATTVCVPSRGATQPALLLVGEAPGPEEDIQGAPFIGRAGQLLDSLLDEARIDRQAVRWSNAVRCIPRDTAGGPFRAPTPNEINACKQYLIDEIIETQPRVIVLLGGTAVRSVLGRAGTIGRLRGRVLQHRITDDLTIPVIVTYHPSYVLRNGERGPARTNTVADLHLAWQTATVGDVTATVEDDTYEILYTPEAVRALHQRILEGCREGVVAIDLETSIEDEDFGEVPRAFDPRSRIVSVQLAWAEEQAAAIIFRHREIPEAYEYHLGKDPEAIIALRELLTDPRLSYIGHNVRYDYLFLYAKLGIRLSRVQGDTLLMHHCLTGGTLPSDLGYLETAYLGRTGLKEILSDAIKKLSKGQRRIENIRLRDLVKYGCYDVDLQRRIYWLLCLELDKSGLWEVYQSMYMRFWPMITQWEINGAYVDTAAIDRAKQAYEQQIEQLRDQIRATPFAQVAEEILGSPINLGSYQQRGVLLYDVAKLPPAKTVNAIARNDRSSDALTLREMAKYCEERGLKEHLELIELYSKYNKIYTEYKNQLSKLHKYVCTSSDCKSPYDLYSIKTYSTVHPSVKQHGTRSGRLSTADPNLHSIPRDSVTKRCFASRYGPHAIQPEYQDTEPGCIIVADYSQMELRVMACLAQDEGLIDAFAKGRDIHTYIASRVFGVPESEVSKEQRQQAKTVSFGVIYGITEHGLSNRGLDLSESEAKELIESLFREFPAVHKYILHQHNYAIAHKCCVSPFGRRRPLPELEDHRTHRHGLNAAVNTPIQGAASDLTLIGIFNLHQTLEQQGLRPKYACIYGSVHDSVLIDSRRSATGDIVGLVHEALVSKVQDQVPWLTVPLEIEVSIGPSWGESQKLEERTNEQHQHTRDHGQDHTTDRRCRTGAA